MGFSNIGFGAEGVAENFTLNLCICDPDFHKTLGLEMAQGRFFSREFPADSHAVILNEKAARLLNWDDAVGRKVNNWSRERGNFTVIGVVKDFHYESLHHEIRPMALFLSGGYYHRPEQVIAVKLRTGDLPRTLRAMEKTWKKFAPAQSLDYSFLDQDFDKLYLNEKQTRKMFTVFSLLALFIACLGLFGLASFMVDQKTKEIGIRKILGASVSGLVVRLDGGFLKWILVANLLAWPAAWFFMGRWLQNFTYRIALGSWMFLLAAGLAVSIALVTVSCQTVKAAIKNPVDSIKFE
jgi:putative ABC transport system permease protein